MSQFLIPSETHNIKMSLHLAKHIFPTPDVASCLSLWILLCKIDIIITYLLRLCWLLNNTWHVKPWYRVDSYSMAAVRVQIDLKMDIMMLLQLVLLGNDNFEYSL